MASRQAPAPPTKFTSLQTISEESDTSDNVDSSINPHKKSWDEVQDVSNEVGDPPYVPPHVTEPFKEFSRQCATLFPELKAVDSCSKDQSPRVHQNDDQVCPHIKMGVMHVAPNGPPGFFPVCHVCSKVPSTGLLYYCQHDHLNDFYHTPIPYRAGREIPSQDWELQSLGLSRSIRQQAETGLYTPEQLQKLEKQKSDVHQLIYERLLVNGSGYCALPSVEALRAAAESSEHRVEQLSSGRDPATVKEPEPEVIVRDFAVSLTDASKIATTNELQWNPARQNPFYLQQDPPYPQSQMRCHYRCCFHCWHSPNLRNFQSLNAILNEDLCLRYLEHWVAKPMLHTYHPIVNANVARYLGTRSHETTPSIALADWTWTDSESADSMSSNADASHDEVHGDGSVKDGGDTESQH